MCAHTRTAGRLPGLGVRKLETDPAASAPSLAGLRVTKLGDAGRGPCPEPTGTGPQQGWGDRGDGRVPDSCKWHQIQTSGFIFATLGTQS